MIKITIEDGKIEIESDARVVPAADNPGEPAVKATRQTYNRQESPLHIDRQGVKHCRICGKELPSKKIAYCSKDCFKKGLKLNYTKAYYKRIARLRGQQKEGIKKCIICGNLISGRNRRFCSIACKNANSRKRSLEFYYNHKANERKAQGQSVPVQIIS
jgi:predicted nucleic acid-binding Zn ribbon protein